MGCSLALVRTAFLAAMALSLGAEARTTPTRVRLNLPPQALAESLAQVAALTDTNIMMDRRVVVGREAEALDGELTAEEAVTKLLLGTGIQHLLVDEKTIVLTRSAAENGPKQNISGRLSDTEHDEEAKGDQNTSFWDRFRLAQVDSESPADGSRSSAIASDGQAVQVEEIVVTAQKRLERLQDVPVPVTAISGQTLVDTNQLRLQDYSTRIPGFSVTPGVQSTTTLSVRGITTGSGTRPSVGIMVDDVPYGATTSNVVPDIDPGDLARIEVLRGPQGTLYGANSMGGLLKFVTLEPDTNGLTGRVQGGLSSVRNGDEEGYNARASINVPLGDALAVRASGFTRRDPGYIDDPALGESGVNSLSVSGGRLAALWRPSDAWSFKLGALYQDSDADGSSEVHQQPGLGDLQHRALRGSGWNERKLQAYHAMVSARLGNAELTSLSGYNINEARDSFDASFLLGPVAQTVFGVSGAATVVDYEARRFTQELRLAMPLGSKLEWLFGLFYTDEDSRSLTDVPAINPATGAVAGNLLSTALPVTYHESAAFTDLTFHVTDRFDIQVGGRGSQIRQTSSSTQSGVTSPVRRSDADVFTYLVTPRFKLATNMMLYARIASGYRPGGANGAGTGIPPEYASDDTQNYEIGLKGSFFDRALTLDVSAYYIDWKDIQLSLITPQRLAYNDNGSRARSEGLEVSMEARPLNGLSIAAWLSWNDAVLVEDLPLASTVRAFDGDRLPYSGRLSGNLAVDQQFPIRGAVTGFAGATLRYVDDRQGVFTATGARQTLPSYVQTDLQSGLRYDAWTATFFVSNLTDKRGVLVGGVGALPPYGFTYIQPRTIGLSLALSF
jgi:outer membrane receptor protein involved in Fe transport